MTEGTKHPSMTLTQTALRDYRFIHFVSRCTRTRQSHGDPGAARRSDPWLTEVNQCSEEVRKKK